MEFNHIGVQLGEKILKAQSVQEIIDISRKEIDNLNEVKKEKAQKAQELQKEADEIEDELIQYGKQINDLEKEVKGNPLGEAIINSIIRDSGVAGTVDFAEAFNKQFK